MNNHNIEKRPRRSNRVGNEDQEPSRSDKIIGKITTDNLQKQSSTFLKDVIVHPKTRLTVAKRRLDLNNIQTPSLHLLSPGEKEIEAINHDRENALIEYADRLRADYRNNKNDFRTGLKLLSDSIDRGQLITITCSCHNGERCHADVVKMAIEKYNRHLKKLNKPAKRRLSNQKNTTATTSLDSKNPRTQRAINEILAYSKTDRLLEQIDQNSGRNRSEHASYLGKRSQFARDLYEHGATVKDGNLIVPHEKLESSKPLFIATQGYAVRRLAKILGDETRSQELAPKIVEYGNNISGRTADGETQVKVFSWIYDSLEGKKPFLQTEDRSSQQDFEDTLEKISNLSEEMSRLEPSDTFVPLVGFEQKLSSEEVPSPEKTVEYSEQPRTVPGERFERIELSGSVPRLPERFSRQTVSRLLNRTLPEIDRQLESGVSRKEILRPFNEMVWQSAKDDTLNRLEKVYQKQRINKIDQKLQGKFLSKDETKRLDAERALLLRARQTTTREEMRDMLLRADDNLPKRSSDALTISKLSGNSGKISNDTKNQLQKIDLLRQNVFELRTPEEYVLTEKEAIRTFFSLKKLEIGKVREKLDAAEPKLEKTLKKQLARLVASRPSFAYKLKDSPEIITGVPSTDLITERNFVSSYINYQLKQPETRLRNTNGRYRRYARQLESARAKEEVIKFSNNIRAENAKLALKWKEMGNPDKESRSKPLSQKELRFLFTEVSPAHYTNEMTAVKLSYAHVGSSRREITRALLKGDISPSPEAQILINSLESRLERRDIRSAVKATKHFFESIRTPPEKLKINNNFDHHEIYQKITPQEKDFVYERANRQKENLEYRSAYRKLLKTAQESEKRPMSSSKSKKDFILDAQFNQARILGESLKFSSFSQKKIDNRDAAAVAILLKNFPASRIDLFAKEFQKGESTERKIIGEVLKTFSEAKIRKTGTETVVSIRLPENRKIDVETYKELLETFYPDRDRGEFRLSSFTEKAQNSAREKGQDLALKAVRENISKNVYYSNAPVDVFVTEKLVAANIDKIESIQVSARIAKHENEEILAKYVRRTVSEFPTEKTLPPPKVQKDLVMMALDPTREQSIEQPGKRTTPFFHRVQNEVTISDFQTYTANKTLMAESEFQINQAFSEITGQKETLEAKRSEFGFQDRQIPFTDHRNSFNAVQKFEERRLLTRAARESFTNNGNTAEKGTTITDLFDASELEKFKSVSVGFAETAFATTNTKKLSGSALEGSALDGSQAKTRFIPGEELDKKLTQFKQGIKDDIANFVLNGNSFDGTLSDHTAVILNRNLEQFDLVSSKSEVVSLSKEISLKIEAKLNPKDKDHSVFKNQTITNYELPRDNEAHGFNESKETLHNSTEHNWEKVHFQR